MKAPLFCCLCLAAWLLAPATGRGATPAFDSASDPAYTNGWANGSNGGYGWGGPWQLDPPTNSNIAGFFIGSSTNNDGGDPGDDGDIDSAGSKAWGVYANSDNIAAAVRPFNGLMLAGQLFVIEMDNGYIDTGKSAGFSLQDSNGNDEFEFYFYGGDTQYRVHDAASVSTPTAVPWTGQGLGLAFTLTGSNTYSLTVNEVGSDGPTNLPVTVTGNLIGKGAGPIARVNLWNYSACSGGGSPCDTYFNDLGLYTPTIWYVSASNTNDPAANGTPAHPFAHIQDGLNAAATNHDTVLVLDGVYAGPGNTNLDFLGKAVLLTSSNGPASTVIDCQYSGAAMNVGSGALVSSFTLTHGGSNVTAVANSGTVSNCVFQVNGGGSIAGGLINNCTFVQNAGTVIPANVGQTVTVENSLFISNQTTCLTGSYNYSDIINCVFEFNQGTVIQSGDFENEAFVSISGSLFHSNLATACSIQNGGVNNSVFEYNQGDGYDSSDGGYDNSGGVGMSNVVFQFNTGTGLGAGTDCGVVDCVFNYNGNGLSITPRAGRGPHGESPQSGSATRCTATGNLGGGMAGNSVTVFNSCTISSNGGGGITGCGGTYVNCLIENNLGPACFLDCYSAFAYLQNCTVRGNNGLATFGYATCLTVYNSIIWDNHTNFYGTDFCNGPSFSYSDVQYGESQPGYGQGCIDADPLFVAAGDSHLTISSPCVATGNASNAPAADIQGTPRGVPPDMGCYELPDTDSVGDGIPNWWRQRYFPETLGGATDGFSCATCDADGTGQNNLFKYIAGLNPTNPASVLALQIANVSLPTNQASVLYSPIAVSRTYTLQAATNLAGTAWAPLATISTLQTNGSQVTATDTNATPPQEFYRVGVSLP